nr:MULTISPECIES: plastocyanin/azurin family copper-binding protein [Halostella]
MRTIGAVGVGLARCSSGGGDEVQSGQSYVRTFETPGEHPFFCIPHEGAGMEGTILVEE